MLAWGPSHFAHSFFLSRGHGRRLAQGLASHFVPELYVVLSMVLWFHLEHNNPGAHLTALVMAGVGCRVPMPEPGWRHASPVIEPVRFDIIKIRATSVA